LIVLFDFMWVCDFVHYKIFVLMLWMVNVLSFILVVIDK